VYTLNRLRPSKLATGSAASVVLLALGLTCGVPGCGAARTPADTLEPGVPTSVDVPLRMRGLLGLPLPPKPLGARVIDRRVEEGLEVEEVRFRAYPDVEVPGTLLRPARRDRPLPAIICMPGTHGTRQRLADPRFHFSDTEWTGWARELARRGFITLSLDYRGSDVREQKALTEATLEQLEGGSYLKFMVDEVSRAVDYLQTRPDVDGSRIGMTGFSLGGLLTWTSGAADPRLKVLAPVCGLCGTYRDLARDVRKMRYSGQLCYPHGFLKAFPGDQPELFGGLAPRAVLVVGREEDQGMPVEGLRALERAATEVYASRRAEGQFRVSVHPGDHKYSAAMFEEVAAWFERYLKNS
jgi:dienelactone hydrolase